METRTLRAYRDPARKQWIVPVEMPEIEHVGAIRPWNGKVYRWHRGRIG